MLSCVKFGSARYSVPVRLIGAEVRLQTDDGRLLVIMTGTGEVVAEHTLVAPGEASGRDEHYGGPRPAPSRAARPKTAAEKELCSLGPVAEAFITGGSKSASIRTLLCSRQTRIRDLAEHLSQLWRTADPDPQAIS